MLDLLLRVLAACVAFVCIGFTLGELKWWLDHGSRR